MSEALSFRVLTADALGPAEIERWSELQQADANVSSPFFSPDFTVTVAELRPQARVTVIRRGPDVVGFFPFERAGRTGLPIGEKFSGYQGVVVEQGTRIDPTSLVRASGLREYRFSHVVAAQETFRPFHRTPTRSPYLDLSNGFDAYVALRHASGSRVIAETRR
jgi:CelD/BcsL family acetyltransferase involved in cellulose biosynthesis